MNNSLTEPQPATAAAGGSRTALLASQVLAGITMAFGALASLGWLFHVEALRRLIRDARGIELSFAAAFMVTGAAVLLRDRPGRVRWVARALALCGLGVGIAVLLQYSGVHRGVLTALAAWSPGEMAGTAAFFFALCAACLLLPRG